MPSLFKTCLLAAASLASLVSADDNAACAATSTLTSYSTYVTSAISTASTETSTRYLKTVTKTLTTTRLFTSYTTKAECTETVATSKGFIPFASIKPSIASPSSTSSRPSKPSGYGYKPKRELPARNARNGVLAAPRGAAAAKTTAATTTCYTTVARPTGTISFISQPIVYKTAATPTTITSYKVMTTAIHSTISTPTATVYAACQNKANTGTSWHGKHINQFVNTGARALSPGSKPLPQAPLWRAANQSPEDCCNAAFAISAHPAVFSGTVSGFEFSGATETAQGVCRLLSAREVGGVFEGVYFWTGEQPEGSVPYHLGVVATDAGFVYEGACDQSSGRPCPFVG